MFYVLAGNFNEYLKYEKRSGLIPLREVTYLSEPAQLEGLERPRVLKINGYSQHPKVKEMELALKTRDAVVTDAYC